MPATPFPPPDNREVPARLRDRYAALHPDLRPYLDTDGSLGPQVRSPIMVIPVLTDAAIPAVNAFADEQRRLLNSYARRGDWEAWVDAHRPSHRIEAAMNLPVDDDNLHAAVMRLAWERNRGPRPRLSAIPEAARLLAASMTAKERRAMDALDAQLLIHRGEARLAGSDVGWIRPRPGHICGHPRCAHVLKHEVVALFILDDGRVQALIINYAASQGRKNSVPTVILTQRPKDFRTPAGYP